MGVTHPGIYADIPEAAYHADPCPAPSLSSSIVRLLLKRSPLHAWHAHPRLNAQHEAEDVSDAAHAGSVLHKILLGRGADIEVIDAKDWRTDAAKAARKAANAAGKTPVLKSKLAELHDAAASARKQIEAHVEGRMLFEPGIPEATIVWQEGGIWCRARADYLLDDPRLPILDLKTTALSAAPQDWERRVQTEYCIQDAFYRRGIYRLRRRDPGAMRFIVIEVDPPHAVSVLCADPVLSAYAEQEVERAIAIWRGCTETNRWPGYLTQTAHVGAPSWLLTRQEEQALRDETLEDAA